MKLLLIFDTTLFFETQYMFCFVPDWCNCC